MSGWKRFLWVFVLSPVLHFRPITSVYFQSYSNMALIGQYTSESTHASELECLLKCVHIGKTGCKSVNYARYNSVVKCQTNKDNKDTNPANFVKSTEMNYLEFISEDTLLSRDYVPDNNSSASFKNKTYSKLDWYLSYSQILDGKITLRHKLTEWLWSAGITKLYRCWLATSDGIYSEKFHDLCDGKGSTVTIVKNGEYIFGGFSDKPWTSLGGPKESRNTFLFSLVNKDDIGPIQLPIVKNFNSAVQDFYGYGPTFGAGEDLRINVGSTLYQSFSSLGVSYALPQGYKMTASKLFSSWLGHRHFNPMKLKSSRACLKGHPHGIYMRISLR